MKKILLLILFFILLSSYSIAGGIDAYTVVYITYNTDHTDSGSAGVSPSGTGSTSIGTSAPKFGAGNLNFNNSAVTYADNVAWTFGSGDVTIDFFFKCTGRQDTLGWWDGYSTAMCKSDDDYPLLNWTEAPTTARTVTHNTAYDDGAWHHYLAQRNGTEISLWIDGVKYGSTATMSSGSAELLDSSGTMYIGHTGDANGSIDNFRISKGIARTTDSTDPCYSSNGTTFTPPTAEYEASAAASTTGLITIRWEIS